MLQHSETGRWIFSILQNNLRILLTKNIEKELKYLVNKQKLHSIALVSAAMILVLISTADATPFANIKSNSDNTVSRPRSVSNVITATINVGDNPTGIAMSPDGTKVYVSDHDENSVYVIDTATNTVTNTMFVGEWPESVIISPDGKKVYVVNSYDKKVSVINTKTNTVTATAKVTGLSSSSKIAFNPTGTKMYVTDCFNNNVYVVNTKTNTVIATVPLGAKPEEITVNPAGTMVYAMNGNNVSVINTKTNKIIATMTGFSSPDGIAITPDGTKVYVVNHDTSDIPYNTVSVIYTSTNKTEVSNSDSHKLSSSKIKASLSKHKQKTTPNIIK